MSDTSWEKVSPWYSQITGNRGHYYHQHVVIPNSLKLLNLSFADKVLDLGCGTGFLAGFLPEGVTYFGIDSSPGLLSRAKKSPNHSFLTADVTQKYPAPSDFTKAVFILSLQNIAAPDLAIAQAASHLASKGQLLLVLNHPCFRIPRQSSWGIDPQNQLQYRRVNLYASALKIPISTHPGQPQSPTTDSFHHSLSDYFSFLKSAGFVTLDLEEWTSDKKSQGKNSRSENRARREFPLFLAILAQKT